MTVTLTPSGDNACTLTEKTVACSVAFPIPCSKLTLVAMIRSILADAERSDAIAGNVRVDRYRDGVKVSVGSGTFGVRYHDAFPLVLEG
jgi:hypothetical protein